MEKLSPKERMKIARQAMPEQLADVRARNFEEVPFGYSAEQAVREAQRCLDCQPARCVDGCPVGVKIPEFLDLLVAEKFAEAARKIKETNALPAVCGRVCPQEVQCESECVRGKKKGDPVAIGRLERFVADFERENNLTEVPTTEASTGRRVAVIGSGPAGLAVALDLTLLGHEVVVFEALHVPGGVLSYGIPEFRLPNRIIEAEVDFLKRLGVTLKLNTVIGPTLTTDDLMDEHGFHAVFVAVGAGLPVFMDIEGENLNGVFSANEYLTRVNLMGAYDFPNYNTPVTMGRNVCVFGGGNVAMDSVRTAQRLGAASAKIVYRRSRAEMPAREEEIHHAEQEGILFQFLMTPIRFIGDSSGRLRAMECLKLELGEPDASGRRRPQPIEGSNFEEELDLAVISIGAGANPLMTSFEPDILLNQWGYIDADEDLRTTKPGVWAGGDIVTGMATVIGAMGAGRTAARSIHEYLSQPAPTWRSIADSLEAPRPPFAIPPDDRGS